MANPAGSTSLPAAFPGLEFTNFYVFVIVSKDNFVQTTVFHFKKVDLIKDHHPQGHSDNVSIQTPHSHHRKFLDHLVRYVCHPII